MIENYKNEPKPTIGEFLRSGWVISMACCIDFTASNGNPTSSGSLHYLAPGAGQLNQYEQAILSIGSILEQYDHDKMFPVFGFGGIPHYC